MKTKLRRVAILALVLVLFTSNTIGASASTTEYSASSYEELVVALEQAENMDTIAISSVIVIPKGSTLGDSSKQVIIKYVGSAYMELELDNDFTATSTITNIIFDGELGTSLYPMMRARGKADFVNCTFKGANKGTVYSGNADLSFTGCTFSYNEGTYGGHFNAGSNTTVVFDRCSFSYGTSTTKGGGIHIDNSTSYVTFRNCIITANESVYGGGIYNAGNLTIESTLLYNNHASTGGDDLCTSTTTYDLGTLEAMEQEFKDQSILIKPLSWETSTEGIYGYECYKLLYTTATTEEPTDPEEPDEGDNTGGDTEDGGTTTPEDTDTGDNEEPTTPDGGDEPTDPSTPPDEGGDSSGEDPVEPDTPSDTGQGDNIDNSVTDNSVTDNSDHSTTDNSTTDNSDHSTTDNSQSSTDNSVTDNSTTDNSTVDNSVTDNSTHTEDNSGSGNTTDNSTHSSTTDNSQHSSTVDNSSVVSNTDNSSSRSESSNTENSNNTTTTYNYYTSTESTGGSQSPSQLITVNVTVPQAKEPETGTQEPTEASQSIAQNIHIEAEGVNVKYEYTADGVSISISPYIAPESPTEAEAVPTAYSLVETPQEPAESPISWVEYVSMILLAILVLSELRDRWFRLKNKAE